MQGVESVLIGTQLRRRFVIHEHEARAHHFDLGLEKDGVLKSWTVPTVFPMVAGIRRLASEVEDHPLTHATFEGTIPQGEYGAGTVRIWDWGTYELLAWSPGRVVFRLHGRLARGCYSLVRLAKAGPHAWRLIKIPLAHVGRLRRMPVGR